jgi:hypothetical protein
MKLAALLIATALLFAAVAIAAEEEAEIPIHLGACEPKQTVTAPDGRRAVLLECDSGAMVIVPIEALQPVPPAGPGPAIPPSEDAIRI